MNKISCALSVYPVDLSRALRHHATTIVIQCKKEGAAQEQLHKIYISGLDSALPACAAAGRDMVSHVAAPSCCSLLSREKYELCQAAAGCSPVKNISGSVLGTRTKCHVGYTLTFAPTIFSTECNFSLLPTLF
jgi:hypothetical protein